jgi:hypothetical protein
MYTALVLNEESQKILQGIMKNFGWLPAKWDVKCHHMTVNMGQAAHGPAANLLGQEFNLDVLSIAKNENVVAVGVKTDVPSQNAIKHITIAVNTAGGGKPKHSNNFKESDFITFDIKNQLKGTVQEVS